VSAIRSGSASGTVNYGYDAVGNLTKKSDFSANMANAYVYTGGSCGGGANAVKSVSLAAGGSRTYCYDANGNLTSDSAGLAIAYDHQNLPIKATRGAQTDWFRYGADGQRTRSWGSDGARVYLPGYEHRTDTGETKVYVGDYAVISRTGSTRKVEYLLKDRLGSVDAVASSAGAITETRGYDAFGKPRDGSWNDLSPAKIASTAVTPKGFTQHEHLNQLELIHMNGRVYDYGLGRFTGVDPIIQLPLNSQSLNPYSYILNNPLSGTDPTGYAFRDILNGQSEVGQFNGPPKRDDDEESQDTTETGGVDSAGKPESNGAQRGQTSNGSDERGQDRESLGDANQNGADTANQANGQDQGSAGASSTVRRANPLNQGDLSVDSRFSNLYFTGAASKDSEFMSDIIEIMDFADKHKLKDFYDLDSAAGGAGTPIYFTNMIQGRKNNGMEIIPVIVGEKEVLIVSVNTRSAIETMNGGRQSPATGVIHEVGHATDLLRGIGVRGWSSMSVRDQGKWQRNDDINVIRGPEKRAAIAFGESTRIRHEVKRTYTATCATCVEEEF
jgi:RHS repeat-associated protein